jgi:hypothetical protein
MSGLGSLVMWPFKALWRLVGLVFEITGRLVAVLLGLVLMVLGVLVSATIIGAVIGIPMLLLGLMLVIRGIF